ncbi:MAG TPA: hypothetical protein VFE93_14960 [Myxococcaceae bacterium]|nr:hypothetical protein [Myxococcaceae bacterium]
MSLDARHERHSQREVEREIELQRDLEKTRSYVLSLPAADKTLLHATPGNRGSSGIAGEQPR